MFKMGSLLAFGTVYLLMHMCAWAQETSEESSNKQTASGQIGEEPPQSVFSYHTLFPSLFRSSHLSRGTGVLTPHAPTEHCTVGSMLRHFHFVLTGSPDERTDTMFKLATLLALGTAYLFMFAWIEEVSAEGATNGPTTSVLEQLAGGPEQTVFTYPFFKQDERTDTMFKLATLLALGRTYLLMFAWIEEVSAVDATVKLFLSLSWQDNRPASPKDVQVKGVSSEGEAIPRTSSNANSGAYYLFWKPGKTRDSGQMSASQSVFSYRPLFQVSTL
ncbi:unnamed protein product [Porites lobata]|uniref:Uncharacterized protein n=1 Tax=Porites lobata TaxID=104759 RepID=A0ABN8NLH5_9CNID|nr:unnamed protein product [Porites lobata]